MIQNPTAGRDLLDPRLVRAAFADAMRNLDVPFSMEFDAFRIDNKQLFVRPVQIDPCHFRFDAFIAMDEGLALERVSSHIMEDDEPGTDIVRSACEDWILACLDPLMRTTPGGANPDTTFNLDVDSMPPDSDRQVLFDVFAGPYLVRGENSDRWSRRFAHSLIDWLIANGELRVPDRPFNLLRLGKHIDASGTETRLCNINRQKWAAADATIAALEWPGSGEQQLLNYVVLRRIDMLQSGDA